MVGSTVRNTRARGHHLSPMTTTEDENRMSETFAPLPPSSDERAPSSTTDDGAGRRSIGAWLSGRWEPGHRRVTVGWSILVASLIVYYLVAGIPWSTNSVLVYIVAGLIVSSLGTGVRWKTLLRDWLPLIIVLFGYGVLRGYASHTLWGPFYRPQDWFDVHIAGLGVDPTVQLQRWLYTPSLHFWDYLVWACYMTHFFASFIIAGVLWKTNYAKFRRFVPLFVGLTFIGYLTYVLYPALPPWLSGQEGHIPHVTRIIDQVWKHLHIGLGQSLYAGGDKFDNNVAAMPSLHGGYPMLICLFFWKGSSVRKRVLLAAYPICMAFSLVYTGEHFVIDILIGWLYAAATVYFGSKLLNRWDAWRLRKRLDEEGALPPSEDLHPDSASPLVTTR
jgi:hypothetical protein